MVSGLELGLALTFLAWLGLMAAVVHGVIVTERLNEEREPGVAETGRE